MQIGKIITLWLTAWSLGNFVLMFVDKKRAKNHKRRIREAVLLSVGLVGGAWGGWLGMMVFRHKTKHKKFRVGYPVMALAQTALIITLMETGVI